MMVPTLYQNVVRVEWDIETMDVMDVVVVVVVVVVALVRGIMMVLLVQWDGNRGYILRGKFDVYTRDGSHSNYCYYKLYM
jgi:hypothetical protein